MCITLHLLMLNNICHSSDQLIQFQCSNALELATSWENPSCASLRVRIKQLHDNGTKARNNSRSSNLCLLTAMQPAIDCTLTPPPKKKKHAKRQSSDYTNTTKDIIQYANHCAHPTLVRQHCNCNSR